MMYSKKDFSNCIFNPLTDEPMLEAYPKLSEIILPDWSEDANLDSLLRYVIMVYDHRSIMVMNERDLNFRKTIAAELAGFDTTDEDLLTSIYSVSYDICASLIIKYLMRFSRSKEWAAICAFESAFWESIQKVIEPIEGKTTKEELDSVQKKAVIKEEIIKDITRLDALYKNFFGDDEELEKKARKRTSPEMIADVNS